MSHRNTPSAEGSGAAEQIVFGHDPKRTLIGVLAPATINPVPPVKGCRMADVEHVALLKQGVVVWNKWREENPDIRLDLIGADLNRADRYNFAET